MLRQFTLKCDLLLQCLTFRIYYLAVVVMLYLALFFITSRTSVA